MKTTIPTYEIIRSHRSERNVNNAIRKLGQSEPNN